MKLNQAGLNIIRSFESCRLDCYLDIKGLATIGFGHRTLLPIGTHISQEDADSLLESDLQKFCQGVKELVNIDLNDNQFSALVCLAFNIGLGNFKGSTLLKLVNAGGLKKAAEEILRWDHANGVEIPGLLRRREAERRLFLS